MVRVAGGFGSCTGESAGWVRSWTGEVAGRVRPRIGDVAGRIDPSATPISTVEIATTGAEGGIALLASIALVGIVALAFDSGGGDDRPLGRSAVVEAASTGLLVADRDGGIVDANSRARALLEARDRDVDGAAVADVLPTLPALAPTDGDGHVLGGGDGRLRVDVDRLEDEGPGEWLLSLRSLEEAATEDRSRAGEANGTDSARGSGAEREAQRRRSAEREGGRLDDREDDHRGVEARYGSILEFLDDAVFAIDGDDRIVFVDEAFAETFGGTPAALAGKHLSVAFRDETWERARAVIERARTGDRRDGYSAELSRRDGDEGTSTVVVRARSVEAVPGVDVLGTVRDVTNRRARERELARYERIVAAIDAPIYVADGDGTLTFVNEAAAALTGYPASMLEGSDISVVLSAEDGRRIEDVLAEMAAADRPRDTVDVAVITRGGDRVPVENEVTWLPDDDSGRAHAGVLQDVSERRRREASLQRYETMVEALGDPLYVIDPDGTISFANGAFETMLGYPVEDTLAGELELVDIVPPSDVDRVRSIVQDLLSDDETGRVTLETRLVTADGRQVPVETNIASLSDDETSFGGTANVARDIADRKRRREVMAVTNRALRHNLRTHLQLIEGYADILGDAVDDADVREYVEGIHASSDWLSKLGDTLRDLQETIERNRGPPDPADLHFLEDLAATYRTRYPDASIEAHVSDRWLVEAGDVVEDAVEHVLENAIVHNDAADPAVRLGASAGARDEWVEIRIADNGPGIPEQERRIIMGEADITQLQHGSGIGLWATRWLVQTIDGEIDIEDREPRGTIVRIRLPTVDGSA